MAKNTTNNRFINENRREVRNGAKRNDDATVKQKCFMAANLNIFGGISEKFRSMFAETWKNSAATAIKRYDVAREFWALIFGFIMLRLATSFVSIFSGYAFFRVELAGVLPSETLREVAAVALLVCVELVTAGFIFKCFKFVFAQRWQLAAAMLAGVGVFFFISFHTSTRGIALYKSDTTDAKITIESKSAAGVDSVANFYDGQIELLRASLNDIKPQTWNKRQQKTADGRDTVVYLLTTVQEQTKTEIYNKILSLQSAKSAAIADYRATIDDELASVQAAADVDANKYYIYVVIIMLLQLVSNGVLCYFYSRIYHENNRADEIAGIVANFADTIADDTDAIINRQTTAQYNQYVNALERRLLSLQASPTLATAQPGRPYTRARVTNIVTNKTSNETTNETTNEPAAEPTSRQVVIKGFAPPSSDDTPTASTPDGAQNQATTNGSARVVYVGDNIRYCQYCGRGFVPNHNKQIYCSNACRGQQCANRNGKTYYFAGVKYTPEKPKK